MESGIYLMTFFLSLNEVASIDLKGGKADTPQHPAQFFLMGADSPVRTVWHR
jgi:hypothetical protein